MDHTLQIEGFDRPIPITPADTVLRAALRAGAGFPYECNSGGCGSCKFEIVSGSVDNVWPEAPGLTDRDRRKNKLLACQCVPATDLTIKVRLDPECIPKIRPERFQARLVGVMNITHDIREFRFATDEPARFLPGQYASLRIDGVGAPRCYSMSNLPNPAGEWHFQIRRVHHGRASSVLFDQLQLGGQVEIDGPFGQAYLREESSKDIVCVAGGSGLAPMVSIARGAAAADMLQRRKLHFFYGGRTPNDLCGDDFLRALDTQGARVFYHPVVSDAYSVEQHAWSGDVGFVHEWIPRKLGDDLGNFEFYFAGPPPMTQAIQEMLMVTHRVPFNQIHFDRFF